MLGPEVYSLAVNALTPQDPFFAQEEPIYDYCGKLVGYTSTVISGDATDMGGNPTTDAVIDPPTTTFEFVWIKDREGKPCWAVTGKESEQTINGRKDIYLNANPEIELRRGYNHTFSIPSQYKDIDEEYYPMDQEFFICKIDAYLTMSALPKDSDDKVVPFKELKDAAGHVVAYVTPRKENGNVVPFNLGLARLETNELLEDANGSFDNAYALERKGTYPFGTTLYFAAEQRVYSGEVAPEFPNEATWWYNLITCDTKRWVPDTVIANGTGSWVEVSSKDRADAWFGSSNTFGDPHVDYLAYSNQAGTVFGLFKFI
jgi:hypothetical protein